MWAMIEKLRIGFTCSCRPRAARPAPVRNGAGAGNAENLEF